MSNNGIIWIIIILVAIAFLIRFNELQAIRSTVSNLTDFDLNEDEPLDIKSTIGATIQNTNQHPIGI